MKSNIYLCTATFSVLNKQKKAVCWSCPYITLKTYICIIMLYEQKLHLKMTSVKSLSVNIFLTHSVSPFLRLARYVN